MNAISNLFSRIAQRGSSSSARRSGIDHARIAETIDQALKAAGLTGANAPAGVLETIEHSLASAGVTARSPAARESHADFQPHPKPGLRPIARPLPDAFRAPRDPTLPRSLGEGLFVTKSFHNAAGTRTYRLYVPPTVASSPQSGAPLVMMLHGCTQSPDDFAIGTRMNELADKHGFLVVYPAQIAKANGSKCWNWFRVEDQQEGRGEPSLLAGIAAEVVRDYGLDERRVFVAGLSAGAAMAVILGELYPERFAAVGAHSGLPFGAATDVQSAFKAMNSGAAGSRRSRASAIPTIVFHGDADRTVNPSNSSAVIDASTKDCHGPQVLAKRIEEGAAPGGRTFKRTLYTRLDGRVVAEHWLVHGGGHAWSGGNAAGSYTEPAGPDASSEMVRFFLGQPGVPHATSV